MKRNRLCSTNLVVAFMLITYSVHASVEMGVKPIGEKMIQTAQTRSVQASTTAVGQGANNIQFAGSTAYSQPDLFLGATSVNANQGTFVSGAFDSTANQVVLTSLAPTSAAVNAVPAANGKNPLYNNQVLAATGVVSGYNNNIVFCVDPARAGALAVGAGATSPWNQNGVAWSQVDGVATVATIPKAMDAINNAQATVFMADPATNNLLVTGGTTVGTAGKAATNNLTLIKDPQGSVAKAINALTASQGLVTYNAANDQAPLIFAAVSDDANWSNATGGTRGVSVIQVDSTNNVLTPLDVTDFTQQNASEEISLLQNDAQVAFGGNALFKGATGTVNMVWDDQLERLFITQSSLQSGGNNMNGAVGLLLGSIDSTGNGVFNLKPIINLNTATVPADNSGIFAGQSTGGGAGQTKVVYNFQPRVMHTTTDKNYLIVPGGVLPDNAASTDVINTWVNALPLVGNYNGVPDANIGKIAKINDTTLTTPIDVAANAPTVDRTHTIANFTANEKIVVVGADPRIISANTKLPIQNIQVLGDTVYASVAGDRSDRNKEAGIFASTAIFDDTQTIKGWTPWQRVAGVDPTVGFGVNTENSTEPYLVFNGAGNTVIKSTAWGNSANVSAASRKLTDVINANFPPSTQGAYHIANFDAYTPGFKAGEFSMTAVVGGQTVALLQMGEMGNAAGMEKPTADFSDGIIPDIAGPKVLVIDTDPVIKLIAPATTAEVLRKDAAAVNGLLYVGGGNGLAKGTAWGSDTTGGFGLNEIDSANDGVYNNVAADSKLGKDFTFSKIDEWDGRVIQALGGDGTNMWVLAMDKLAKADGVTGASGNNYTEFDGQKYGIDMVIAGVPANPLAIVATTAGLFTTDDAKTFDQIAGIDTGFTPIHLEYLSMTRGVNSDQGNLLVLATNHDANAAKVYRFYVDAAAGTVTIVDSISLDEYRRWFAPNGAMYLASSNNTTGKAAQANLLGVTNIATESENDITDIIRVDTTQFKYVGAPIQDTATGGWIVPGDFGVRVNE